MGNNLEETTGSGSNAVAQRPEHSPTPSMTEAPSPEEQPSPSAHPHQHATSHKLQNDDQDVIQAHITAPTAEDNRYISSYPCVCPIH